MSGGTAGTFLTTVYLQKKPIVPLQQSRISKMVGVEVHHAGLLKINSGSGTALI